MADATVPIVPTVTDPAPAAVPAVVPVGPAPDAAQFDRSHPAFKAVTKQVSEKDAALAALQAQLDEIQNKDKAATEAAELKAMEEKGQYDAIIAKKTAEIELLTKAHTRAMVESNLKVALLGAGANNEVFLDGATSRYTGEAAGIGDYVAELKAAELNAPFFGVVAEAAAQGLPAANSGTPAAASAVDFKQLRKDLTDPAKAAAASKTLTAYADAHEGALPPGF